MDKGTRSIPVPPLGCGNGGLDWRDVKPGIEATVYEPTAKYQNVRKSTGVQKLTPARALVAEMVRRYCVLGMGCTVLEVQKLAWFITRGAAESGLNDPLDLSYAAHLYGPYSDRLRMLLNSLDGSYLRCERRLAAAGPTSEIWFEESKGAFVSAYLQSEGKEYKPALEWATRMIRGFESPLGMELLATVDWLLQEGGCGATVSDVRAGLKRWGRGRDRKLRIFDDRLIGLALQRLAS